MMLLKDRNIFITGGSRGIGRAAVMELARHGANVAFTYVRNSDEAEAALRAAQVIAPTATIRHFQLDVRNSKQVDAVAEQVIQAMGKVDVVINNAGIVSDAPLYYMTDGQWRDVIETHLTGTFYVCRAFLEEFIVNKGGKFINISSISHQGSAGQANYAAAKAGIIGLSKTIAKEYGHKDIYCNVIIPGYFKTEMTEKNAVDTIKDYAVRFSSVQREGRPEEFGRAVIFLASDLSSFVNGETLYVTGGLDSIPPVNARRKRGRDANE